MAADAADAALRSWALRSAAPLVVFGANAAGVTFTPALLLKGALAAAYTTALTGALVYWRIAMADERRRTVQLPAADGGAAETLSVRTYDVRALKELCTSVAVGLGVAYMMHALGVSSNLLVLQSRACFAPGMAPTQGARAHAARARERCGAVMLPITVADHELVRLHVRGAKEAEAGLRRPWRSEAEKLQDACVALAPARSPLRALTASRRAQVRGAAPCVRFQKGLSKRKDAATARYVEAAAFTQRQTSV